MPKQIKKPKAVKKDRDKEIDTQTPSGKKKLPY